MPVLPATRLLLASEAPFAVRSLACRAVAVGGGADDAAALLERMLAAPDGLVCRALMATGTRAAGESLLQAHVVGGALRDGVPEAVLHALGYLGVEEAEPVLWSAARSRDHYVHQAACLGLVDLPCRGREAAIADEIRGCHGHNLFGEFWPALAGKVGDAALLDPFIASGAPTSTDCLGGVLLGLALTGARATFERVLWDPWWEATDGPTGNLRWCGLAVRILGLSVCALARGRGDEIEDSAVDVLAALVRLHARSDAFPGLRAALAPVDDDLAVYMDFFADRGGLADAMARRDRAETQRWLDEARAALEERLAGRWTRPGG